MTRQRNPAAVTTSLLEGMLVHPRDVSLGAFERALGRFATVGNPTRGAALLSGPFPPEETGLRRARPPSAGSPARERLRTGQRRQRCASLASAGAEQAAGSASAHGSAFCPYRSPGQEGREAKVSCHGALAAIKETPASRGASENGPAGRSLPPPPPGR